MSPNNIILIFFLDAFMIAFSSAINSLLWCVETQLDLVNAQWPEKLFENPESSIVIRDDKVIGISRVHQIYRK